MGTLALETRALALAASAWVVIARAVGQQWWRFERGRQMVASVLALGALDHLHCAVKGHNYPEIVNPPHRIREKLGPQYARDKKSAVKPSLEGLVSVEARKGESQ